jgi:hypothetical protein
MKTITTKWAHEMIKDKWFEKARKILNEEYNIII